jgi:Uncharacterised nucleotidyltransferase
MLETNKRTVRRRLEEALVAAVGANGGAPGHERLEALVERTDPGTLVDFAIAQRVTGPASQSLPDLLTDVPRARLLSEANFDLFSNLSYLALLVRLAAALREAEVPWVIVKGPVLAEMAYGGTARYYSDLDVVVPAAQFGQALEVLTARGASTLDRNWELVTADLRGQLHLGFGPELVDLHWHLVNLVNQRDRFAIPMAELFERRRQVRVGTVTAWALDPTDAVLHVALHAALAGGHQLGWLVDVDRSVRNLNPDWRALVQRSRAWHTNLPVAVALNRAKEVLGAPVPPDVVTELSGGPTGRLLVHSLRKWRSSGSLPGGGSIDRALTRSLRDGYPATAAEVTRSAYEMVQRRFDPHEYWLDPDDPRNVLHRSGDGDGLERYLERVSATDLFGHSGHSPSTAGQ